jgi:hypothetical protein
MLKAATEGCKFLEDVKAYPPYLTSDSWKIKLRNKAGRLEADLVYGDLISFFISKGKAYKCEQPPVGSIKGEDSDFIR